jgi:hypothetical protein
MDDHVGFGGQNVDGFPIQDVALLVRRLRPAVRRRVERLAGHPDDPTHDGVLLQRGHRRDPELARWSSVSHSKSDKRTRKALAEQFSSYGQIVVEVPFDSHLRPGGVIDGTAHMDPATRRRFVEIAAGLAEQFPTDTSG